jgi:hypothetical protein
MSKETSEELIIRQMELIGKLTMEVKEKNEVLAGFYRKMQYVLDTLTIEERGEGEHFFDIVVKKMRTDKESLAKFRDLFDPHNLLDL